MPLLPKDDFCYRSGRESSEVEQARMDETEDLKEKLVALRLEHRDLDEVIDRISGDMPSDQIQIQRLKKRKLLLKDEISKLESILLPDIIA